MRTTYRRIPYLFKNTQHRYVQQPVAVRFTTPGFPVFKTT
jgi:hypothetical protein